MSIPTSIDPMGTLGKWPSELLEGLLDGWLLSSPGKTCKGVLVNQNTNKVWYADGAAPQPGTVLVCGAETWDCTNETGMIMFGSLYYLQFYKGLWGCLGTVLDTPTGRWLNGYYRDPATEPRSNDFAAAFLYGGGKRRVYINDAWTEITGRDGTFTYTPEYSWANLRAWAAYPTLLGEEDAIAKLEILKTL